MLGWVLIYTTRARFLGAGWWLKSQQGRHKTANFRLRSGRAWVQQNVADYPQTHTVEAAI